MNLFDRITGNDIKREWKSYNARAKKLPGDYKDAWVKITQNLFMYSNFSGRNLLPILSGVIDFLEEKSADGQNIEEVLGGDIEGFCKALASAEGAASYHDKWRAQLNSDIMKKLGRLKNENKKFD